MKRQHSAEPLDAGSPALRKSPASNTPTARSTPPRDPNNGETTPTILTSAAYELKPPKAFDESILGSPLKKQRASLSGLETDEISSKKLGLGLSGIMGDVTTGVHDDQTVKKEPEDEL